MIGSTVDTKTISLSAFNRDVLTKSISTPIFGIEYGTDILRNSMLKSGGDLRTAELCDSRCP
jgi:hypothetical protein